MAYSKMKAIIKQTYIQLKYLSKSQNEQRSKSTEAR